MIPFCQRTNIISLSCVNLLAGASVLILILIIVQFFQTQIISQSHLNIFLCSMILVFLGDMVLSQIKLDEYMTSIATNRLVKKYGELLELQTSLQGEKI